MFQLMSNIMNQIMVDCQINFIQNILRYNKVKKFAHAHISHQTIFTFNLIDHA